MKCNETDVDHICNDPDHELLRMQERKSIPTVKIQEYMSKGSNDSCGDDSFDNSIDERDYKVKTHHVI